MNSEKFYIDLEDVEILIITGVCRSGKTLLARFLSTMSNTIYFDEPWVQMTLPIMQGLKLIDKNIAKNLFQAITKETINDGVLLRNANFRPDDQSTILNQKSKGEINFRLNDLKSRMDVEEYIKNKKPVLIYVLSETIPFMSFFQETFSNVKIIHVIRDAIEVAQEVDKKGWFSNASLKNHKNTMLYRELMISEEKYYFPWWIKKGEEVKFIKKSGFEKGLHYWRRLLEINKEERINFKKSNPNYKEIIFNKFIESVDETINDLESFVNVKKTERTNFMIKDFKVLKNENKIKEVNIPKEDIEKINELLSEFGFKQVKYKMENNEEYKNNVKTYFSENALAWVSDQYRKNDYSYPVGPNRIRVARNIIKEKYEDKKLNILDIGCGAGTLCMVFAKQGHKVTGVDQSEEMLKLCNDHLNNVDSEIAKNINFISSEITELSTEQKFDVITCMGVFEYLTNQEAFLKKISSLLTHDGILIMDCRNKLFNMISISDYTSKEIENSTAALLVDEIKTLYGDIIPNQEQKAFINNLGDIVSKINTSDEISNFDSQNSSAPNFVGSVEGSQETPKEITEMAKRFGLTTQGYRGIHPHILIPKLNKMLQPQIFNKISDSLLAFEKLPISLLWSSKFIVILKNENA